MKTERTFGEWAESSENDLISVPSVSRLLYLLNEILSMANIAEDRVKYMFQCIINVLLKEVIETASRLPTVDMTAYFLNCMHQIQSTLGLYDYMDQRL